jgi:hypothetical protein
MMKLLISQDPAKNLNQIRERITPSEDCILTILLEEFSLTIKKYGGTTIPHDVIATKAGVSTRTVERAISKFRLLGLFTTERRFDNSNVTKMTSFWRRPNVQKELSLSYSRYPIFRMAFAALSLGLLLSTKVFSENMSVSRINLKTVIRNGINLKDPEMKEKISKVLSIRDALLRRGEKDPIDCYKLLAFSNACLDDCIAKMKHATPGQPYSFFVSLALEYSKWNSEKPDWTTVDTLRQQKLREFETKRQDVFKKTMPEKTKDTQKRDDVRTSNTNRTQLTKQQEREAAEARKTIRLSFEEELEGYEKQIELLRAKGWAAEGMLGYLIRCRDEFIRNSEPACPSQQLLIQ